MEAQFTRLSIGTQLRQAFDAEVEAGRITEWKIVNGTTYLFKTPLHEDADWWRFTPGQAMDMLNERGYDIRFGKNPQDAAPMLEP